jgi:hypothetical protein
LVAIAIIVVCKDTNNHATALHLLSGVPPLTGLAGLRADGLSTARGQIRDQKSLVGGIRNDDHEDEYDSFHFASLPICDAAGRPFRHIDAELQQLEALRERGIITDKEFEQGKKQLLGSN